MPFHDIWQPNLALSILKQSLCNAEYSCDIHYANIEFANKIGPFVYNEIIDESIPFGADLLFVDYFNNGQESSNEYNYDSITNAKQYVANFIEDTAQKVINGKYDLIGFNVNFHTIPCLALSRRIKELSPGTKIIFGGSNCNNEMGLALHENFPWIDFVCRGEGEHLIVEIADYLSRKGRPIQDITGLIWRDNGQSISNGDKTELIVNLDTVPTPDFDDWMMQIKAHGFEKNKEEIILPFESSRGCWHGARHPCIFCGLCAENQTYRIKSSKRIINELLSFSDKYTVDLFFAMDLVFPYQYYDTFLPDLKKLKTDLRFGYEIRATITKNQLKAMYDANVTYMLSGIESLNTNILCLLRKGTQAYQNIRLLKWGFGYGINILWFQLYGCPGEKPEDYENIARLTPFITHLLPPKSMELISMHRFSPLYEERQKLNLKNVKPNKIYKYIYKLPEQQLGKLAYYFEYENGPFEYIDSLKKSFDEWHSLVGKSIFFFIAFENKIHFYDTRPIANEMFPVLSGKEKDVYLACDAGVEFKNIAEQTDVHNTEELQLILQQLCSRNLIILIDNRYLNLAVEFYNPIFQITDITPALCLYAEIYKTWMLAMFNSKKNTHK